MLAEVEELFAVECLKMQASQVWIGEHELQVGALGLGLGGRLAFGPWSLVEASTPGRRKISRRKPCTLNTSLQGERFKDIQQ